MPVISVILPAFNAERTIEKAVRSVLEQTLQDIEVIVVDDGSTDETASVVRSFHDRRLKLICCEHAGVACAANTGLQHAQADVIARMDADDFAWPRRLSAQLQYLNATDVDVVGCQVRILNNSGSPTETLKRYERWINEETLSTEQIYALRFVEFPLVNPTITAHRRYFELGFHDNELPEDYDLMLRAAAAGMRFGKVGEVLFDWIDGESRLTRNDSRYSDLAFMKCRRRHLLQGPLAHIEAVDLWGVGQTGKPWLRWLQEQKISVRRAYDVSPRKIGLRIHGVPVVDGETIPKADRIPLIVAVGADGARSLIREHIKPRGYIEGVNTWFVA